MKVGACHREAEAREKSCGFEEQGFSEGIERESGQVQRTGSVGNSAFFTTEPYRLCHHKA